MAKLYVTEYELLAREAGGIPMQGVPQEPAHASQVVDFTSAEAKSAAFNARTRLIRIATDTACFVKVGASPTAVTATDQRLAAGESRLLGVAPGHKISAVS